MQLRVARLCLDCEEIHTQNRCPRCISEQYALLTTWLPVEERRRFRRAPRNPMEGRSALARMFEALARWIRGGEVVDAPPGWATRRSDQIAHMTKDEHVDVTRPLVDTRHRHSDAPAAGSD
jgi:hypothetical protein